ncbi:uncharacterized protein LOC114272787 [Camellia sinensis]|uniref:uncharacterized protein LOC114272787 n=1 Tax=Camellia sinensis TaxID=4442 RepID=UPI00103683F0|nr:uncharacterized protein LOC114272787 [Camellia sinensis]
MTEAVDDLQSLGSSSDELRSIDSSSDEGGTSHRRQYLVFNVDSDMHNPQFKLGMEFKSHDMFRDAVKEYAIKWRKHITFTKNDKQKVRAKCKVGCPWVCYASYVKHDGLYRIKTLDEHTCNRSFDVAYVSSKWIVKRYFERIRLNPTWPIQLLSDTISSEHNVKVDLQKERRARNKVLTQVEGTAAEQFAMLWSYIEEIRNTIPKTTICIKVKQIPKVNEWTNPRVSDGIDIESKFKRLYFCWGPLKKAFMNVYKLVIGVDGCHLKGSHGGILLTAGGIDAKNCIFPFAYVIVEKKKKKTWLWFLELLEHDLNIVNSHCYTFMSDKQKGLIDAVAKLFPNASHRFCVRHLYNNFKGEHKGLVLKDLLWKTARVTTIPAFTKVMAEIKEVDCKYDDWLVERPPIHWSRSHFSTFPKCDLLLNNLCECFNSSILEARSKPVVTMLEKIRFVMT